MPFKKSDEGRYIKIKDNNKAIWLATGERYKIMNVITKSVVKLDDGYHGNWNSGGDENYQFIDEINRVEVGDEVLIEKDTQSIKGGTIKKVTGFLHDDKNKIIVEGLLPAGWIDINKVIKLMNPKDYRLKTLLEFIKSFGIDFYQILGIGNKNIGEIQYGRPLDTLPITRQKSSLVYTIKNLTIYLNEDFLEPVGKEPEDLDLYIISKVDMRRIVSEDNEYYKGFVEHAGKKLSELKEIKSENELIKTLTTLYTGFVNIRGNNLPRAFLQVRKNENNEKIPIPNPSLPF